MAPSNEKKVKRGDYVLGWEAQGKGPGGWISAPSLSKWPWGKSLHLLGLKWLICKVRPMMPFPGLGVRGLKRCRKDTAPKQTWSGVLEGPPLVQPLRC